jgi:hypothetical protein
LHIELNMPILELNLALSSNHIRSGYSFVNYDALEYYNTLISNGLTASIVQGMYSVDEYNFKKAIDTLYTDIKTVGFMPNRMWLFLGNTQATQNIECISRNAVGTFVASPTYAGGGIQFNGTTQYFDTSILPTDLSSGGTGDAVVGVHMNSFSSGASKAAFGSTTGSTSALFARVSAISQWEGRGFTSTSPPSTTGGTATFIAAGKLGSNAFLVKESTVINAATGGTAPSTQTIYLGAINSSGSAINHSSSVVGSLFMCTAGFDQTTISTWRTAFNTFNTTLNRI